MNKAWIILVILLLSGCAHRGRYPGWEFVRIEKAVPDTNCEYKVQESCSGGGARCYNYHKKRATKFGSNTVVLTEVSKSQASSGGLTITPSGGGGGFFSGEAMTTLADYYYCPKKQGECK